ncbi:uncharacterized protein LOC132722378 [Ruditapes philippinarum]|uniref:uncharacterized protein LOC132722378 n=1 Tax=Ruditapes philippinarum TaxID=129788 RepID=UPI00295C377A|nr:uncharacterized protein LOC132722378 [Ruditapes philippinarum]
MVQKKGKHGIRTGNTIRAVNTKYVRRYRKDAQIIQREATLTFNDHTEGSTDVIELADISCTDLFFSLNKKKRWLLPELLKDEHADVEFGPINFELVERHKLLKNSNCRRIFKSYITSDEDETIRTPTHIIPNNYYVDADNILKTQSIYSRHFNRLVFLHLFQSSYPDEDDIGTEIYKTVSKKDEDSTIKQEDDSCTKDVKDEYPRVRYEVFYPCELTNVLTKKPKQIGNDTKKIFKCRNYNRRPWTLQGYQFKRSRAKDKRDDIYDEIREGLEDYSLERDNYKKYNVVEENKNVNSRLLKEIKNNAAKAPLQTETKLLSANEPISVNLAKDNTNCKRYFNNDNERALPNNLLLPEEKRSISKSETQLDYDDEEESTFFPRKIVLLPVCVLLRQEEIDVSELHRQYGDDVLECNSSPRRFVINISKYIQDLDLEGIGSAYKLLRIMNKILLSWLIFAHDPMNKLNSVTEKAFNVSLNANFTEHITRVRIEGLVEGTTVSIATVIEKTINYLKNLPRESMIFEKKPNVTKYRPIVKSDSLLAEMKRWSCWTYIPDNFYVLKHVMESSMSISEEKESVIHEKGDQSKKRICSICYKNKNAMIALLSCFHVFCNACWEAYIHEKIELGSYLIYCPQEDCSKQVDIGTIMSFLSVKEILAFARRYHNNTVEKNKLAKWCTNETCGRVIIVNASRSKLVRCHCGELLCFVCLGTPHWPLPCRKYLDYVQILLETRDKNISPNEFVIKFDVKYCLVCFKVVKHYDRCMTIDCPCGSVLCFRCSYLWHARKMPFHQFRENTTASTKSRDSYIAALSTTQNNTFSLNKRTKWYKLAMKHRLNQHPYRLAKIQASSKLLANRINHFILREERKGTYVNIDFAGDDASFIRESERATNYMTHIVNMYKETSSIIENTVFSLNEETGEDHEANALLHRRAMIMSTCAKTIFDLIKDGAFLNAKVVIERLNSTRKEIRRVMECIVKDL